MRPAPLRAVRFLVDANLAKLASLLRMCGLDATDAAMLRAGGSAGDEDARLVANVRREQLGVLPPAMPASSVSESGPVRRAWL